jgi:hypothetical protein
MVKQRNEHGIITGLLMRNAGIKLTVEKAEKLVASGYVALEVTDGKDVTIVTGDIG